MKTTLENEKQREIVQVWSLHKIRTTFQAYFLSNFTPPNYDASILPSLHFPRFLSLFFLFIPHNLCILLKQTTETKIGFQCYYINFVFDVHTKKGDADMRWHLQENSTGWNSRDCHQNTKNIRILRTLLRI